MAQEWPAELLRLFMKTARSMAIVGTVIFTLLYIAAPTVVRIVFGSAWTEAGFYLQSMIPAYFMQFLTSPLSQTLNMVKRPGIGFVMDCIPLVLSWLPVVVASHLGAQPYRAVMYLSVGTALGYGLYLSSYMLVLRRLAHGSSPI